MIIKGFVTNIKCYTGKVYVGTRLRLHRVKKRIVVSSFQHEVGELDPDTTDLIDLYVPFAKEFIVAATELHDGEKYPVEIKIVFNF